MEFERQSQTHLSIGHNGAIVAIDNAMHDILCYYIVGGLLACILLKRNKNSAENQYSIHPEIHATTRIVHVIYDQI
jgi:hypothetical protein